MHGPKLWAGKRKKKSYLHVIIDDCSRYVVSGRFYQNESTESLIMALMTATRRFGIAQRLYTELSMFITVGCNERLCSRPLPSNWVSKSIAGPYPF